MGKEMGRGIYRWGERKGGWEMGLVISPVEVVEVGFADVAAVLSDSPV